ncbi:hypothetical protein M409DRAFT_68898 [Zasmidium cellare ATCC 36951]|uniref:Amidohydrolase-related domain-containing protein n=1 Tax=Zasmidium cellare ATCC 36951 TaxID=1080233 RepID=A0A6A6CBD0_ZASCE|nr:uncharacterized protein M409DRAFT_68898 [Zasmidium cellare ATCC 36951]KAF2162959.1 hypothetical protein M409DRAFT_68898 [Zasmidium cellare ATCC 36951]
MTRNLSQLVVTPPHHAIATATSPATTTTRPQENDHDHDHEDGDNPKPLRIDANLLIPGRGKPIPNASLIYHNAKILHVGPTPSLPKPYASLSPSFTVPILMPGLWDAHVHFFGEASPSLENVAYTPPALAGLRAARDLVSLLDAGFTNVREVGGYGVDVARGVEEGWIPGPHIYAAGAPLSQTAGHGDLHTVPLSLMHDKMAAGMPLCLADGVDEAIKGTRTQIRRGAKVIKICSTGGVMSRIDSPRAAQFTNKELEAVVEEARRTGLVVASHAHGTEGILAAINAGVHTIEHGSYLTSSAIDLMVSKKIMLIATRTIIVNGVENPASMTPEAYKKLLEVADSNRKSYEAAIKAGVKCALGTDLGLSNAELGFYHGMNGREFGYAVDAGMSPLEAIEAGTANGPDTLGPQAPKSGILKEGYDADFIALTKSPLEDIGVLARPGEVSHVWKGGRLFKEPGRGVMAAF